MTVTPFDPDLYVGTIMYVSPDVVRANLPYATAPAEERSSIKGAVGDFVFIECEPYALFGRIIEVKIPESERFSVETEIGKSSPANPLGAIQLLASLDLVEDKVMRGLVAHPKIGDRVYIAHPTIVANMAGSEAENSRKMEFGELPFDNVAKVLFSPERVFGRHCGVLGTTGGGKSWTLATIMEEIKAFGGKAILFDATGEFFGLSFVDRSISLGDEHRGDDGEASFSYRNLTESDFFTLFNPSGGVQGPKLREAIRSLKLVDALNNRPVPGVQIEDGLLIKEGNLKAPVIDAFRQHSAQLNSPQCTLDVNRLAAQMDRECVWPNGFNNDATRWGGVSQNDLGYCVTLVTRIEALVNSPELNCLFNPQGLDLVEVADQFLADDQQNILRISMEFLSFQHNARELIANSIGRFFLSRARARLFANSPLVVILDEAHQFLDKSIGDDFNRVRLDSFGLIAKEGRKYGLTTILATQRPRDIPEDVLSQLGTLIVHRLINDKDRLVVERACGELDRSATAFLPTLDQGEALIVGADFSMPVPVKMRRPNDAPSSHGPDYQANWQRA